MKDLTIIVPVIDMDKESNQNLFTRAIYLILMIQ